MSWIKISSPIDVEVLTTWLRTNFETDKVQLRYGIDGLKTNYVLRVHMDGEWIVWDRVNATSGEAAAEYFRDRYPSYEHMVEEDSQTELYDFIKENRMA